MKQHLAEIIRAGQTPAHARNIAREYLQARILGALQRSGAMIPLAFHGGTALRFLFAHDRYSEDLDFGLEGDAASFDFRACLRAVNSELAAEGYQVDVKANDQKTVHSAFIRLTGLLYELGLSSHRNEVLSVKIEVDTNPPDGAGLATTVVRRHLTLQLHHHDRATLMAGKLHAILQRPYAKGRDLYDLLWYLSDPAWPPPNFPFLNNALRQTGAQTGVLNAENWRGAVWERLQGINWEAVVEDVRPFLEPAANPDLLTRQNVGRLLKRS